MTTTPSSRSGVRRRVLASLAALGAGFGTTVAGAGPAFADVATTPLAGESFAGATTGADTWMRPSGGGTNTACLTGSTSATATPLPGCPTRHDAAGSGVLRLTDNTNATIGSAYNTISLPTSRGLDVTFDTYQYGRDTGSSSGYDAGADGLSFSLAATDPADPRPPVVQGAYAGSLGYSAAPAVPLPGTSSGYLGFGLDVFGNWTNSLVAGTDCGESSGRTGPNIGVRGPGNGTRGYCLIADTSTGGETPLVTGDLDKAGSTARPAPVPVEVAINPSASAVSTASGLTVAAGSWALKVGTYTSGSRVLTGELPSIDPALGFPTGWYDPATGVPYQLSFGWNSSTGGSNEVHEISGLQSRTLTGTLPVYGAGVTGGPVQVGSSSTVSVTPTLAAGQGGETRTATVTTTFPIGLTPRSGSFTTDAGYDCSTTEQDVVCRITPADEYAPGTSLPTLAVPVSVPAGTATGSYRVTTKVSSTDAMPVTAAGSVSVVPAAPGAPTGPTATPGTSSVLVSWHPPTSGTPAVKYRVIASPGEAGCVTTGTSCVLGAEAGVQYTYTVVAIAADGSESSTVTVTTSRAAEAPSVPAAPPADAPLTLTTTDGDITTATPGQRITVLGTGFLPYSTATVVIYSTPVVLGTVTTDANGDFRKPVTVPTDLEPGAHSLVAYGVDPSGVGHALRMNVQVAGAAVAAASSAAPSATPAAAAPAAPAGKKLAFTGATVLPYLGGGAALLAAGGALLLVARRRRAGGVLAD